MPKSAKNKYSRNFVMTRRAIAEDVAEFIIHTDEANLNPLDTSKFKYEDDNELRRKLADRINPQLTDEFCQAWMDCRFLGARRLKYETPQGDKEFEMGELIAQHIDFPCLAGY